MRAFLSTGHTARREMRATGRTDAERIASRSAWALDEATRIVAHAEHTDAVNDGAHVSVDYLRQSAAPWREFGHLGGRSAHLVAYAGAALTEALSAFVAD